MRKLCSFLVMLLMSFTALMAQITVSGIVLSAEDNEPIIGAAVIVKGTQNGISTDIDGKFTLTNVPRNATLVVSYVGMQTQEVAASKAKTIVLSSDDQVLDEVMVVAYGTAKKSSFTGSASVVNSKQMEKRVITNATSALEGNTSGVQVTSASGQPGSSASIRVRGFGSVNASSAPLYVVDGAVYDGDLADINPADIESMTILKDAASTSLYGSSAGNGVVLITTKSGKGNNGTTGISLSIQQGWSNRAYKDYAVLGVDDYMTTTWEKIKNMRIGLGDDASAAAQYASDNLMTLLASKGSEERYNPYKGVAANQIVVNGILNRGQGLKYADDLDWDKEAYRTGHRQEYTLSYNTKTDKSDTYASASYLNEQGYMVNTDYERFSGRLNYNVQPLKWLKTGLNLSLSRVESSYSSATSSNSSAYSNISYFTRIIAPYWPVHAHDVNGAYLNSDGKATTIPSEYEYDYGNRLIGTYVGRDGLVEQLWNSRAYNTMAETANTYLTITPIDGLSITANYSLNNRDYRSKRYENPYVGDGTAGPARLAIASTRSLSQTFNQIIQYKKMIGKNNIDVTAGHESYQYMYEYFYSMKTGETIHGINDFDNFTNTSSLTSYTDEYKKEGWLARLNYDWDNKYYASFSYRHDGSSRFAKDNRWGDFWSAGLSWRLTQEEWMKDIDWVDNLKLRASYGETGNDQTDSYYPYQTLYGLGYTNGTEAGAYFTTIANPDLKWETQVSTDLGLEFTLFHQKLSGSVEYFKKDSKDLLFDVAQPYSQGISSIVQNIGKVSNSGVEINLDWNAYSSRDWKVTLGANATFIKNKMTKLPEDMKKGYVTGSKKWMEGKSIYEFWLYQWEGVDPQTGYGYYQINEKEDPQTGKYTGEQVSVPEADQITVNGKQYTTNYTYAKKDFSGASIPKMYGGFNFNVSWKSLTLGATFSYQLGGKVLDTTYADLMNNSTGYGNNIAKDALKAWKKPGDKTDVPMLSADGTYNTKMNQSYSSRWLTSSNYLNLRSINLSYELPKALIAKAQLKSARLTAACENVFMIKARQGLNPQANFTGLTYNEYMPSRNFTLGLNVSF